MLPNFKINGQYATLRYIDRNGRKRVVSGRRSFLVTRVTFDAILTEWGHDFEIRLTPTGPWHKLKITPNEAAKVLADSPLSRSRLKRLQKRPDYVGPT